MERLKNRYIALGLLISVWIILVGYLTPGIFGVGIVFSFFCVLVLPDEYLGRNSFRVFRLISLISILAGYMFYEAFLASYRLAFFSFHPASSVESFIIGYDYHILGRVGILSLASLVTLTPGTVSLCVDKEKKRLYVHCLINIAGGKDNVIRTIGRLEMFLEWMSS